MGKIITDIQKGTGIFGLSKLPSPANLKHACPFFLCPFFLVKLMPFMPVPCYGDGQGFGLGFHGLGKQRVELVEVAFSRLWTEGWLGFNLLSARGVFQRNMLYAASERRGDEARPIF